tara:strand:+ start:138 stop:2327 length:2190 start_codon:yes stop_codon:yes gene_type:complete
MAKSSNRGTYDVFFEVDGDKIGFNLASGENDVVGYATGLAPAIAPRVDNQAFTFSSVPPEIKVPITFEDWSGGIGYPIAGTNQPNVYNYGIRVDGSTPGMLSRVGTTKYYRRSTYPTNGFGDQDWMPPGFGRVKYTSQGTFLLAGNIYKWNGTSWDLSWEENPATSGAPKELLPLDIIEFNGYVFVTLVDYWGIGTTARTSTNYVYTNDGGATWTTASGGGVAERDFLYFAVKGQTSGNPILYGVDAGGELRNNTTGIAVWSAAIQVGETTETITGLLEHNDTLYVFKTNGIYKLNTAGTGTEDVWIGAKDIDNETNGSTPVLFRDGNIYCTYDGYLIQFNPSTNTLVRIFPVQANEFYSGQINAITTDGEWLYLAFQVDWSYGATYTEDTSVYYSNQYTQILKGNPNVGGFHPIGVNGYGNLRNISAVPPGSTGGVNPELHRLVAVNRVFPASVPSYRNFNIWNGYLTLPRSGEDFSTDPNVSDNALGYVSYVWGPWVDLNAINIDKYIASAQAIVDNASAGSYWNLYWQFDYGIHDRVTGALGGGEEFINLNTGSPYTDFYWTLDNPITSRTNDANIMSGASLERWRSIRYVLEGYNESGTSENASHPRSVSMEAAVLPERIRTWSMQVEVSDGLQLRGGGKQRDGYIRQRNFLFDSPAKQMTYYDRDGQNYVVKIQDIQSVGTRRGQESDYEVYSISLSELVPNTITTPLFYWGNGSWNRGQRYNV